MSDVTDWLQAVGSLVAVPLSIIAIVQSNRAERNTRKAKREDTQRLLLEKTAAVSFQYTVAPDAEINDRVLVVAAKAEKYEELMRVYADCFAPRDRERLANLSAAVKQTQEAALAAAQLSSDKSLLDAATSQYVNALAIFVNAFEETVNTSLGRTAA